MQAEIRTIGRGTSDMSLDWSALGRLVRRRACDEVAAHFAAIAEQRGECVPTDRDDQEDQR